MKFIDGKKTYLAAVLSLGVGAYVLITGEALFGVTPDNAFDLIVAGFGMIGFRSALGKGTGDGNA